MNGDRCFVDTNVFVYAYDASAGPKHDRASALVADLWRSGDGCVSVQVLQEFVVNVTRKIQKPLDLGTTSTVISDLTQWRIHRPGPADVLAALDCHRRWKVSFWDAMILCSAAALGCGTLYSEDLSDRQQYESVRVRNPFV